ncbi:tetratricopeptide repeat protein [Actinokineospora fastidiosa]|uniref:Tetratricopeptide repeat protein n=1 Tax=Actinokineospora fastidiosa TaxID=1816 RepID=A0A918GQU5_9PSEU|nr:tetratricopeptide repeat protein [Actinokineospora fastidiosa]GGS54754.1 hypothetical protein GCM10010171_57380 [Actinokineospora fastidiosa]
MTERRTRESEQRPTFRDAYAAARRDAAPLPKGNPAVPVSVEPPLVPLPRLHGRADIKKALAGFLDRDTHPGLVVLHGIAGGGKSALALWLTAQAKGRGWDVYWAADGDVARTMPAVAERRDPGLSQSGMGVGPDQVWETLERADRPWLLVFDNVDDVDRPGLLGRSGGQVDGTGWVRPGRAGLVVVTSRRGDRSTWGGGAVLHRVDCLPRVAGARVLFDLAPDAGTPEEAEELVGQLGGLALAVRLAGKYLAADPPRHRTFAEYRVAVSADLAWLDVGEQRPATLSDEESARLSIRLTWELSLRLLESRGLAAARPVVELLSCYGAPHPIPVALLDDAAALRETPVGEISAPDLARVLRNLVAVALVDQVDVDGAAHLTLHPLLTEVVGAARDAGPHRDAIWATAVDLLHAHLPATPEPAEWLRWRALPAVQAAVLGGLRGDGLDLAVDGGALCAFHLLTIGSLHAAHEMSELTVRRSAELDPKARVRLTARLVSALVGFAEGGVAARDELGALIEDAGAVLPVDSAMLIVARQQHALALATTGRPAEAEQVYADLFADHDAGIGSDHVIATRFGYAQLMSIVGEYDIAEAEIEAVFAAETAQHPDEPDHPNLLVTRTLRAEIWLGGGRRLVEAREDLQAVLRAQERLHGPDSPLTLGARVTLIGALHQLRDESGAEDQLTSMLRIQRDALNAEHPLSLLGMAALISLRTANPPEGTDVEATARVDDERLAALAASLATTVGDDHLVVLSIRLSAAMQRCVHDWDAGKAAVLDVLSHQTAVYGEGHIATLNTRLVYAQLLVAAEEDQPAAERELRDLLRVQEQHLGERHPQTAAVRAALANITFLNHGHADSERLLRESLEIFEELHGPDHPDTLQTRATHVQVLATLGRFAEARAELRVLIDALNRAEPDGERVLAARLMLALLLWEDRDLARAERELRDLVAAVTGYDALVVRWILGEVLKDADRAVEAETELRAALEGIEELGDPDDDVPAIRLSLGELLHGVGRLAEAERHLQVAHLTFTRMDEPEKAASARQALTVVSAELRALEEAALGKATPVDAASVDEDPMETAAVETPAEATSVEAAPVDEVPVDEAAVPGHGETPGEATAEPSTRDELPLGPEPSGTDDLSRALTDWRDGRLDDAERALAALGARRWLGLLRWERGAIAAAIPSGDWSRAELLALRRETCATRAEDDALCAELATLDSLDARRLHAIALADQGFPRAAYAQLTAVVAARARTEGLAARDLVDLELLRPDDGGPEPLAAVERLHERIVRGFGADHDLALRLRRARGERLINRGRATEAVNDLDATLVARTRGSAFPDREKALVRHLLATAVEATGGLRSAAGLHRQAMADLTGLLGSAHPLTLTARAHYAALRSTTEDGGGNELHDVLDAQVRRLGPHHPDVAATRYRIGVLARTRGDHATAARELAAALRIRTTRLGCGHPLTTASRRAVAVRAEGAG